MRFFFSHSIKFFFLIKLSKIHLYVLSGNLNSLSCHQKYQNSQNKDNDPVRQQASHFFIFSNFILFYFFLLFSFSLVFIYFLRWPAKSVINEHRWEWKKIYFSRTRRYCCATSRMLLLKLNLRLEKMKENFLREKHWKAADGWFLKKEEEWEKKEKKNHEVETRTNFPSFYHVALGICSWKGSLCAEYSVWELVTFGSTPGRLLLNILCALPHTYK